MRVNPLAVASLTLALLTLPAFCIGFAPFLPLTVLVCYPPALLGGMLALLTGFPALAQIRTRGEGGRWMALTGITTSGLMLLAMLCDITLTAAALSAGIQSLRLLLPGATPLP